ncbi:MAG: 3-deoxy-manno-octulosonate cytidylyltransferase [Chlamydiales bacterium]
MTSNQVVGIIPARWNSTRFPGKPLIDILGKSLIKRTYEKALKSSRLNSLLVATDDHRIYDHVKDFGGNVCMTSISCPTGTDRVSEAIKISQSNPSIVVSIQGDEPCFDPTTIDTLIEQMQKTDDAVVTTPVTKITNPHDILNSGIVKCVFDYLNRALYFSRAPIPFSVKSRTVDNYYRHIGIYCFRGSFLEHYVKIKNSRLQNIEDLEQLKILEMGHQIYVSIVKDQGIGVDTPKDLKRIKEILCANISL